MSEQPHSSYERSRATYAIDTYRRTLSLTERSYIDSRLALQAYVEMEFAIDDAYSDHYIAQLEVGRILPSAGLYERDVEMALDWQRHAMYSFWMPLYRETHTSDEFSMWLPAAMEVILPAGSKHSREKCDSELTDSLDAVLYSASCPQSSICPVRLMGSDVILNTPYLPIDDMEVMEYEQKACDPTRLMSDANTLLTALYDKRVITANQMRAAKSRYGKVYERLGM